MDSQMLDAVEFRAGQRQQWQKGAEGWRKRSAFIDAATAPVSRRMVELAHVEPGSRVLDVAAGYGEPSLTAAAVAGPEGKVVATDISPEMLLYGRERAAAAGLENVEFVESEAASLDFPAESSMLRCPGSGSSSSQKLKPRLAGCGASSSRVRGW